VSSVAVNAEQAADWNRASGREFVEQRERHERVRDRLSGAGFGSIEFTKEPLLIAGWRDHAGRDLASHGPSWW
jgi:hypothetical protein